MNTVGDHILALKMLQKEVADQIGVGEETVFNWEANMANPGIGYMPGIIEFLGYNPLPPAASLGERLVQCRTILGMNQKESARRIGVDPGTLARCERGEREPAGAYNARVQRFLATAEATWSTGLERTA